MAIVRKETEQDIPLVRRINELAFGQPNEANLVDALRNTAFPHIMKGLVTYHPEFGKG